MSRRVLIGNLMAVAGAVATGWAVRYLVFLEPCGGDGPPCPPEADAYLTAFAVGLPASIIGGLIARSLIGLLAVPAVAVGAWWAFLEAPPGESAMPLVVGLIATGASLVPGWFFWRGLQRAQLLRWLFAHGQPAVATLTGLQDTGMTVNQNPRVRLTFRVTPDDGSEAFEAVETAIVPRVDIPRAGYRYPAWYDPADRSNRHAVLTRVDSSLSPSVRDRFAEVTAGNRPAAPQVDTPAQRSGSEDKLDRLAKLNELRLAGALTEEEFAAEKKKLLASDD